MVWLSHETDGWHWESKNGTRWHRQNQYIHIFYYSLFCTTKLNIVQEGHPFCPMPKSAVRETAKSRARQIHCHSFIFPSTLTSKVGKECNQSRDIPTQKMQRSYDVGVNSIGNDRVRPSRPAMYMFHNLKLFPTMQCAAHSSFRDRSHSSSF
jgi:hypothetical protein